MPLLGEEMRWRTAFVVSLLALLCDLGVGARAESLCTPPTEIWAASTSTPRSSFDPQQATHWCWAATVANVFRSSGHVVSQARIVREVYGDAVNMRSGPATNVAALLDRGWTDDAGGHFRARLVGVYDAASGRRDIRAREVVAALRAGRPLVVGTTSHAMLLIGASYRVVGGEVTLVGATVFDPWPGVGVRALRGNELVPVAEHGELAFIADVAVSR